MKVLVTGHRGYIGVEAVPVLRDKGHEVVGLDTGFYDECDFVSPPDEVPNLDVDLRDVTADHLRGFDAVAHLGALSNDPLGDVNPGLTYDINLH
ncbi:MAG TPA: NAD(P)-dependent oxidoreductase, partial [Polyangiales bacterium]|nr:NAD(P)-dependent oxidoreductase [Polyangiales bacterium]